MNNSPGRRSGGGGGTNTSTTIMRTSNGHHGHGHDPSPRGGGQHHNHSFQSPARPAVPRPEDDISRMRIRFEDEMKQVESQMNRLRSEFEPSGSSRGGPQRPDPHERYGPVAVRHETAPTTLQTPLIRDDSDERMFNLKFDVHQYLPEEISVKTVDDQLIVKAKHEERFGGRNVYREFNQDFKIPRNVDPQSITSTLSVDGILSVEAPKLNGGAIEYGRSQR